MERKSRTQPKKFRKLRRLLRFLSYGAVLIFCLILIVVVVGFGYEMATSWKDRKAFPPPGQLVDVGGYRLHLLSAGAGNPTVIMDSGLGSSALYWGKVVPLIAKHTRVCLFDRAGYGWSDPGPAPRTTQRIVMELHTLLENARIPGPYILVGWSFGGFTMRMYAHQYPSEVAGVVLVESAHEEQFERYVPTILAGVKKTGLNLEPLMRTLGGPERTHTLVETTVSRINLMKSFMGLARWGRRNEQGNDFWKDYPVGTEAILRYCELQHGYVPAVLGEQKAWEESIAQIRQVRDLGDLPLIVVSRKQDLKGPFPEWFPAAEIERQWQTMQTDLLRLSRKSKQVLADPSDHLVPHRQPQVVADSVLELVQAAHMEAK